MKVNVELIYCDACGLSNMDGAPDLDIPYPKIERREESGNELLCEECHKAHIDAAGDDPVYRDPSEKTFK